MSRKIYETEDDLIREKEVAKQLKNILGISLIKMRSLYEIDFCSIHNNFITGVVEIRCRNYSSTQIDSMGGYLIATQKMFGARKWLGMGIPFLLAVSLTDGLFTYVINPDDPFPKFKMKIGGRTDRGDSQDMEPCCLIPMNHFQQVAIKKTNMEKMNVH